MTQQCNDSTIHCKNFPTVDVAQNCKNVLIDLKDGI